MDQEMLEAARRLLEICVHKKLMLGLAESCTGGLLAATLTAIPGSSEVLDRGFVTYSDMAKQQIGVSMATLDRYGAVSRETAEAMAKGVLANAPVSLSAAITGIAGPGGGSPDKPIGVVHFAVAAARSGKIVHREQRYGDIGRAQVRQASVLHALTMLQELAEGEDTPN
jgi:nicotinamide-nucleotide amidase